MNTLGIYFGPQVISIVETKGKKPINNTQIAQSAISPSKLLEEKVSEEVKLVTLFKDELRKNAMEAKEATVSLSGKDLIIRTFEVPVMPPNELPSAINFEAKKYIPFKIEDLVSSSQWKFDKSVRKNRALFVGIKKETLDKYRSILDQLDLKINSVEYAAFSVLRLLKLNNVIEQGIIAVVNIDLMEDDEINFMVLENGFPLFSRDIIFVSGPPVALAEAKEFPASATILEKLKREIRISLDYYHRKLPTKNIKKILLISSEDYRLDLETFIKELGLSAQFIDASQYIGKAAPFSLSFIKGYSSSLYRIVKTPLKINLLAARQEISPLRETGIKSEAISLLATLRLDPRVVIMGLLACVLIFLYSLYFTLPLRKDLKNIISIRPQVSKVRPDASYEELTKIDSEYKEKINTLDNLIRKQIYLTSLLDVMPRILPEGMWLESFSFKREENKIDLTLEGMAYLGDSTKEFELVNGFLSILKKDQIFNRYFKEINLVSLNRNLSRKDWVTNFLIACRSYKERE